MFASRKKLVAYLKGKKVKSIDYFRKEGWKNSLQEKLGIKFDVISPEMPNRFDARYKEWKIWFEKLLPFVKRGAIFIGHSLGGMFLAKYLSENTMRKKPGAVVIVAAPYNGSTNNEVFKDFKLPRSLARFSRQCKRVYFFQSKDDPLVPFEEVNKYRRELPGAELKIFSKKQHFNQSTFPELVWLIKSI